MLSLSEQIAIHHGQIVSKTFLQNKNMSITLFAFDKNEEISTHDSNGDAIVTVVEGTGEFTVDNNKYLVSKGETLIMPANKPHSVFGYEAFKMVLVVVFPQKED